MMREHLPECLYGKPCPNEWRNEQTIRYEGLPVPHRIVSGSGGQCTECYAGDCVCDEIRDGMQRERQRIREGVLEYYKVAPKAAEPLLRIIDGESS
jgi:hypothetical protein